MLFRLLLALAVLCSPLWLEAKKEEALCQVYFSPKDHLAERLIDLIEREEKHIQIAAYCLTHRKIAQALIQARGRGVVVELILDPYSLKAGSMSEVVKAGIPVYIWEPTSRSAKNKKFKQALMHDKFCVFGKKIVWTGSYNFTYKATSSNQENAVVLESAALAGQFSEQFEEIKRDYCISHAEYIAAHPSRVVKH